MRTLLFIALAVCAFAIVEVNAGQGCHYEGKDHEIGSTFRHECLKCKCSDEGKLTCNDVKPYCEKEVKYVKYKNCTKAKCPKIDCPDGSYTPPRRCCPRCYPPCHKLPRLVAAKMDISEEGMCCKEVTCRMYCEYGYKKDKDGCDICKCKMDRCDGYTCADDKMCTVENDKAECKPKIQVMSRGKCDPVLCKMYCEFGFESDENGCETCMCKMNPCKASPVLCPDDDRVAGCEGCLGNCTMSCHYGYKTDDNDCPICECRANPCAKPEEVCSNEMPYCVVKYNKAVCQKCSPVMCMMFCQFGFKMNSDGCEICECKPHPCLNKECLPYHMCYIEEDSMCEKDHCPPVAKCKAHPFLACKKPETDDTGNFTICAGKEMVNCSDGYDCRMSPGHYPSVCCPSSQCKYGDKIYNIYETFDSDDGCNKCFCMGDGNIGCTLMACPKRDCTHNGMTYKHGDSLCRGDGCNTCNCIDGEVACTKMYCPYCKAHMIHALGDYVDNGDSCQICQCINDPSGKKGAIIACAFKNNCIPDQDPMPRYK
ncbi:unnamed protein product [Owenia fusiformis]|uniref:Kielin/chordin-like protein n=1 Tax=Owenia fusiformis TaxID=6347 RepID=A0A8S4PWL3_OWEFU|nr:unnamed protein product [Owenia fusiformis]